MNFPRASDSLFSTREALDALSLQSSFKPKIIVGIDYGTTFSGVSFVTTDKSSIEDIKIIDGWPGDSFQSWKTPTRIAYCQENDRLKANEWGFRVHPKLKSYSWTKLLLDKNANVSEHDDPGLSGTEGIGAIQLPSFRDAQGVCEDFLSEVYKHTAKVIKLQITESTFDKLPMECWITLPAIWSDEAKAATLAAAKNAGFGRRETDEVFTISEPEAAAIATLNKYTKPGALNPIMQNENILICDCGGGTVDITTYKISQVQPYLLFDELCVGAGGKCGSTYIDRNLHALLSERFGSAFDDLSFGIKGPGSRFMTDFEGLKRNFGRDDNDDDQELGPINMNAPESEFYDSDNKFVVISNDDMKTVFDPVVDEIINLVGNQIEEAEARKDAKINRIILVGGLGESAYLNKVLAEWCEENGEIALLCPANPQAAVVQGAALRGLEGIAPQVKYARRHYGYRISFPFREGVDPKERSYVGRFNGKEYCTGRMKWLISKGDEITKNTNLKTSFTLIYTPGEPIYDQLLLYSCALAKAPEYFDDPRVDLVGTVESTISRKFDFGNSSQCRYNETLKEIIHKCIFDVQVRFGDKGDNLNFKCTVNGKEAGSSVIKFDK